MNPGLPHNKQPPAFATLVIETKAMTQQPYSDCPACVGYQPTHCCWAREVAHQRFIPSN